MEYKVAYNQESRQWEAVGDNGTERIECLLIPGLNHSLTSTESILAGLHEELYNLYQYHHEIQEGDTFSLDAGSYCGRPWASNPVVIEFPAARWYAVDVHVLNQNEYDNYLQSKRG